MKRLAVGASLLLGLASLARQPVTVEGSGVIPMTRRQAQAADTCGPRRIVEIREADPAIDPVHHAEVLARFIRAAGAPDTAVLLGPDVVLDFSEIAELPVAIARCVTIQSVASFDAVPAGMTTAKAIVAIPEARSSTADGPLLRFGPHRSAGDAVFLEARCTASPGDQADHIRLSGFRIHGPSFGQQRAKDVGILVSRCVDINIGNMELAGFGGDAIRVEDDPDEYVTPESREPPWELRTMEGVCQEPPYNGANGRIGVPSQVRIHDSYIHHNQQPQTAFDSEAGGHGVTVTDGAYAEIARNVFSANHHAIAGGGTMGGFEATQNLILRYGGVEEDGAFTVRTHTIDVGGTGDNGFNGWSGARTLFVFNAFQYNADNAIYVRGSPRCGIHIAQNVFPHHGLENDWGADALRLQYRQDIGAIQLGPGNQINTQTYGRYGICDFDGDGVDDLFLATGVSWWFSGRGQFPWRFMAQRTEQLSDLRLGYFDEDTRCDVLAENDNAWIVSSGGTEPWARLGDQHAPLSEVVFGRFDLAARVTQADRPRRATHAFWRTRNGQWQVTTLTGSDQGWRDVQRSGLQMNALRFGDFDGDGVTDVLAVDRGRWAFSSGGAKPWQPLNASLGTNLRGLIVADIDNNGIDDVIRMTYKTTPIGSGRWTATYVWEVSRDGRTAWQPLKEYSWNMLAGAVAPHVYAGGFGPVGRDAILTLGVDGIGHFFAPVDTSPDWTSTFPY